MHTPSSLDTQRQYHHCRKEWLRESNLAVNNLYKTLISQPADQIDFFCLFLQAAEIRKDVAKKLKHKEGVFGILRNQMTVIEDFYYSIGSPIDEAWTITKEAVAKALEETASISLEGEYERFTQDTESVIAQSYHHPSVIAHTYDLPTRFMREVIQDSRLQQLHEEKQVPYITHNLLKISDAILTCQPLYAKNKRYDNSQTQLHETPAYTLQKFDRSHRAIQIAEIINEHPESTDEILQVSNQRSHPDDQKYILDQIKDELLPHNRPPVSSYRLIGEEPVQLDVTSFKGLLKSIAKGLKQVRLSSDCMTRLIQISQYHKDYRIETLQPIINAKKENDQQPLYGQFLTFQHIGGSILTANFKSPALDRHTASEYWKFASFCFMKLILANVGDTKAFMQNSAKLMYTMAHFIPVQRGNAGIMQWILNAIAKYKLIHLPAFNNEMISWDFKAISSTEETFTAWWHKEAFIEPPRQAVVTLIALGKCELEKLSA